MQIYFFAISIAGGGKCGRFLWRCQESRLWRRAYKCGFYKNAGDESALFLKQITASEFASPSLSNSKKKNAPLGCVSLFVFHNNICFFTILLCVPELPVFYLLFFAVFKEAINKRLTSIHNSKISFLS